MEDRLVRQGHRRIQGGTGRGKDKKKYLWRIEFDGQLGMSV